MDKSNEVLSQILKEELERLVRIESVYKEELDNLPKGKVMFKNIKGRDYSYLQYRSGSKIKRHTAKRFGTTLRRLCTILRVL